MPPKVRKLRMTELLNEVKKNSDLAKQSLIQHGIPDDINRISKQTLFSAALNGGFVDLVRILLAKGASISSNSLHTAAQSQNARMVQQLLQFGAPIDSRDNFGMTALLCAIPRGNKTIVNFLLQQGANCRAIDNLGRSVLHLAVEGNASTELLNTFLTKGIPVDAKTRDGRTALHIAVKKRNKELIEYFLLRNANLHLCDNQGNLPLHFLISEIQVPSEYSYMYRYPNEVSTAQEKQKEQEVVSFMEWLISKGADTDVPNFAGETPIHLAAERGKYVLLAVLLRTDPKLNAINKEGKTALHLLLECIGKQKNLVEDVDVPRTMVENEVNVDIVDKSGNTALHLAAKINALQTLKILLQRVANVNIADHDLKTVLYILLEKNTKTDEADKFKTLVEIVQLLLEKGANVNIFSKTGESPLHLAAKNKQKEIVQLLLPSFTNVNAFCDKENNTVLHILLSNSNSSDKDYMDMINTLISKGANVNLKNKNNLAPLQIAAKRKLKEFIELLLRHGADLKLCEYHKGKNILYYLTLENHDLDKHAEKGMVQLLVKHGANVNVKTETDETLLHKAAETGCNNVAEALVEHGVDVNAVEKENLRTPLHVAVKNNKLSVVELLLNNRIDINAQDIDGKTVLHIASSYKSDKLMKMLLARSADVDLLDKKNKTALHYACWFDNLPCVESLLEYGADVNLEDCFNNVPIVYTTIAEVQKKMVQHVIKLEALDIDIHSLNEEKKDKLDLDTFYESCLEEVRILKETMVGDGKSVYDILHMHADKLSKFKNNAGFLKIMFSFDFKKEFSNFWNLILACYRIGVARCGVVELAVEPFKQLIGVDLPDLCVMAIFSYLKNQDLRHLIEADRINANKRKLKLEKRAVSPTKKQKLN